MGETMFTKMELGYILDSLWDAIDAMDNQDENDVCQEDYEFLSALSDKIHNLYNNMKD